MFNSIYNTFKYVSGLQSSSSNKVVIMDVDKTIGDFDDISWVYRLIETNEYKTHTTVFSLFPNCFRPGIFDVFKLLIQFKENDVISKVILYTNNTGGKSWVSKIIDHIHQILKYPLFDDLISAFIVNSNEVVDTRRTTHLKQIHDVQNILNLNETDHIMFVDDMYHEDMFDVNVFYIHIKPYQYSVSFDDIIHTLSTKLNIQLYDDEKLTIKSYISPYCNQSESTPLENEVDVTLDLIREIANFILTKNTGYTKI